MPFRSKKYSIKGDLRTIVTKDGIYAAKADDSNGSVHWSLNGKDIPDDKVEDIKFYDDKLGIDRTLSTRPVFAFDDPNNPLKAVDVQTPIYTPYLTELSEAVLRQEKLKKDREQRIPLGDKIVTLRTNGRMNLADIPTNLLDSIAVNSGRSGTSVKTNLGLIGKESTFGGLSHYLGNNADNTGIKEKGYSPHELTNNHAYFYTPEDDYYNAVIRKYNTGNDEGRVKAERDIEYAKKHGLIKNVTPQYSENIMADAFARYAANPTDYNPGQGNYVPMVNNIAEEVWNDANVQKWWKDSGKAQYERGQKEGMAYGGHLRNKDRWDSLSMKEKSEMMKAAVQQGIYNLSDIRKAYNEYAEGGPTEEDRILDLSDRGYKSKEDLKITGTPPLVGIGPKVAKIAEKATGLNNEALYTLYNTTENLGKWIVGKMPDKYKTAIGELYNALKQNAVGTRPKEGSDFGARLPAFMQRVVDSVNDEKAYGGPLVDSANRYY